MPAKESATQHLPHAGIGFAPNFALFPALAPAFKKQRAQSGAQNEQP